MLTSLAKLAEDRFATVEATSFDIHRTIQPFFDRCELGGAAQGQALRFAPNSEIYGDGEENEGFYRVLSGVVRTCKFRPDGQRQIEAFHLPGEIFGFITGVARRVSAEAVCDSAVVSYQWCAFESPGEIDAQLVGKFFVSAMQSLRCAQEHSLLLGRHGAAQKVAGFLVEMADRAGCDKFIDLPMARQDIADYLGLTMETVSRTFKRLERGAIISLPKARRVCVKDERALRRICS
jgi:CRP/FNR family nitrogen fixation transcriptional regulator